MGNTYSDKEINDVLALYYILCSVKKEASIQYLDGISGVCKTEEQSLRKSMFKTRLENLLDAFSMSHQ